MSDEIREAARRREDERRQVEAMRRRFTADIRSVAGTAEGRRLLTWLLGRGGLFCSDCPIDPDEAMFLTGRRSAAVELWNMLRANLGREEFVSVAFAGDEEAGWRDGSPEAGDTALIEEGGA